MPGLTTIIPSGLEVIERTVAKQGNHVLAASSEVTAAATESLETTFKKLGTFPPLAPFFRAEKTLKIKDLYDLFRSLQALPAPQQEIINRAFQEFTGEPAASLASIAPNLARLSHEQVKILGDFFRKAPTYNAAQLEQQAAETFFDIWRVPGKARALTKAQISEVGQHMKPGDIVVMGHGETLAGTESWLHAAVYRGRRRVVHATTDAGVTTDPVTVVIEGENRAAVLRHRKALDDAGSGEKVAQVAYGYVGRPYDFAFQQGDYRKLFCTEVVFGAFNESGLGLANSGSVKVAGQNVLQVSDMFRHPDLQLIHIVRGRLKTK